MKDFFQILGYVTGVIFLCFAAVYVFTRTAIFSSMELKGTGEIGDTIGGITSPIIGIMGAVLVYLSFRQQFRANELQQKSLENEAKSQFLNREIQQIDTLFNSIKTDVSNLSLEVEQPVNYGKTIKSMSVFEARYEKVIQTGIVSIIKLCNMRVRTGLIDDRIQLVKQVIYILHQLLYAFNKAEQLESNNSDKMYLENMLSSYYRNILLNPINSLHKTVELYSNNN